MDEFIKHKVLFLLVNGWTDFGAIQQELDISDDDMHEIITWLHEENYITTHTIH